MQLFDSERTQTPWKTCLLLKYSAWHRRLVSPPVRNVELVTIYPQVLWKAGPFRPHIYTVIGEQYVSKTGQLFHLRVIGHQFNMKERRTDESPVSVSGPFDMRDAHSRIRKSRWIRTPGMNLRDNSLVFYVPRQYLWYFTCPFATVVALKSSHQDYIYIRPKHFVYVTKLWC